MYREMLFKILGLTFKDNKITCNGRKGILHVRTPNGWEPAMFSTEDHSEPYVCDCAHEALEAIIDLARQYKMNEMLCALLRKEPPPEFFMPEDFMYIYVEDMVEHNIEHTHDADSIINKIKGT